MRGKHHDDVYYGENAGNRRIEGAWHHPGRHLQDVPDGGSDRGRDRRCGGSDTELYRKVADTGDLRVAGAAVRTALVAGGLRRIVRGRGSHSRRVDARAQGNAHQPQRSHPL